MGNNSQRREKGPNALSIKISICAHPIIEQKQYINLIEMGYALMIMESPQ